MKDRLKLMERCLELVRLARRKGEAQEARAAIELEVEFSTEINRLKALLAESAQKEGAAA